MGGMDKQLTTWSWGVLHRIPPAVTRSTSRNAWGEDQPEGDWGQGVNFRKKLARQQIDRGPGPGVASGGERVFPDGPNL
tara:strand:+ start:274 stop:510 length:237 start_codon:yes stop_codon:yes gene_type:complete